MRLVPRKLEKGGRVAVIKFVFHVIRFESVTKCLQVVKVLFLLIGKVPASWVLYGQGRLIGQIL